MDSRTLERIVYKIPVIDMSDFDETAETDVYSLLGSNALDTLIGEDTSYYIDISSCGSTYIFLKTCDEGWYIDVYVFTNVSGRTLKYERFIIMRGYQMEPGAEERFLRSMSKNRMIFTDMTGSGLFNMVSALAPDINLKDYPDMGVMLTHIYFALNISGLRELMFKAGGLDRIAFRLSDVNEYNIVASNISEGLDGIPVKMLRKFNTEEGVMQILKFRECRQDVREIYDKYHSILNDLNNINYYQFCYLQSCLDEDKWPDKMILNNLANLGSLETVYNDETVEIDDTNYGWELVDDDDYDDFYDEEAYDVEEIYRHYIKYQHMLGESGRFRSFFPNYPSLRWCKLGHFESLFGSLKMCVEKADEYDRGIEKTARRIEGPYAYSDGEYTMVVPHNVIDVMSEARSMHNCLEHYLPGIASGSTFILFMRTVEKIDESLVSVEIGNNCILQARQRSNEPVTAHQRQFLEAFAKAKGLKYIRD